MAIAKTDDGTLCAACQVKTSKDALKCRNCAAFYHLSCTRLPDYHLVRLLIQRQSTFTCGPCIQSEERYEESATKIREMINSEVSIIDGISRDLGGSSVEQETAQVEGPDRREDQSTNALALSSENVEASQNNTVNIPVNNRTVSENSICQEFLKKKCKHGKSGKVDGNGRFRHPKICFAFLNGVNQRDGCKKGKDCKFFHPKLCWSFSKRGQCSRQDCRFYHFKKKDRKPIKRNVDSDNRPVPRNEGIDRHQFYSASVERNIDPPIADGDGLNKHFLALQEQMKDQMRQTQQLIQVLLLREGRHDTQRQSPCQCGSRS